MCPLKLLSLQEDKEDSLFEMKRAKDQVESCSFAKLLSRVDIVLLRKVIITSNYNYK